MVKKEEYKLSVEGQNEVDFVDSVVDRANKMANVTVAVTAEKGRYDDKNKAIIDTFRQDVRIVVKNYKGNLVALEQTRTALDESRKQAAAYHSTAGQLRDRVEREVARSKTLEGRLEESSTAISALTTEKDTAVSQYNSEKAERENYQAKATKADALVLERTKELSSTKSDLSVALSKVDGLSTRANTRTSIVQTLLQTYFGVPESTFKGVAENKREDFVYKLLEEQLNVRAAKDKKVEDELNEVLGGNTKDEASTQTGVNRVKSVAKSGNGK